MTAWEERFSPVEQIRERESRDWWDRERADREREKSDMEFNRQESDDDE